MLLKKITVILLFAIYLFNLVGYSLYYNYVIAQSDKTLVQQIDNSQFNDSDLTEIKIPLHLPYTNDWDQYERVDGEVELEGIHYNYVKRKVHNDTLYLMCLPNMAKTKLYQDKNDFAKGANDLPANKKDNTAGKKNGFSNEYNQQLVQYTFIAPLTSVKMIFKGCNYQLQSPHMLVPAQPPEAVC